MHFGLKQSNRSQQALQDNPQAQRGPSNNSSTTALNQAGGEDKAFEARAVQQQPQTYTQARNEPPQYILPNNQQGIQSRAYEEAADLPSRSQSHRHTAGYPPIQPPSPIVATDPRQGTVDDQALAEYQRAYNIAQTSRQQQPPPEQKKSKSARFFSGFSSKSTRGAEQSTASPLDQQSSQANAYNNTAGIGRRISKRHKDPPPTFQTHTQNDSGEKDLSSGWQSGQNSDSHLPSPHEADEDDSGLDPYLIRQSDQQQLDPSHSQIHGHQQVQPTIRLARIDQDPSVRIVDDSEQSPYSQQQQQQLQLQLQQQQQQQQPPLQLLTHQQPWLAQQNSHQSPGSPVSQQNVEYQHPAQPGQYQTHSPHQAPPNLQFRNPQNPEVISQLSHDSPTESTEDQRPPSVQSLTQAPPSAGSYAPPQPQSDFPSRTQSLQVQGSRPPQQASAMPPPPGGSAQNRRSTDAKQALQQEGRAPSGPPPGYSQQQSFGSGQGAPTGNPLPPVPGQPSQGNYRGSSLQREYNQGGGEQGRNTPPLPAEREMNEADKLLLTKYKKVKTLYFEKQAQVEQLQNTLANQRLSQSRTSLDDNEYATRFNRLDGAIKEIAFSIRKDWKTIPRWLMPFVNQDAQKVGTKEMTAVGRAAISRWIWEEIFQKCFHPSLEPPFSAELKRVEQNLRYATGPSNNQEEMEALTSKVIQWKLATVEGLGYQLSSPSSIDAKMRFTQMAVKHLTTHLLNHLQDPAPQGIEGNATSIIELAVGIASHLPLESRDICITYPLPGDQVQAMMKIEPPLPALENPALDLTQDADSSSSNSDPKDHDSGPADGGKSDGGKLSKKQDPKKGMLSPQAANNGKKTSNNSAGTNEPGEGKAKDGIPRVRFAAFMGVEVRGRQYLVNPPVWTIS